ncbi:MAG: hypothetical protein L6R39_001288 [Caloplaca ligustica]|nr:MAG: hypothetical protein L6R39_001288 [Caloplaca ligustica]
MPPRRVAATTIAARVAEEVGCKLGEEVGYSIRFEDLTSVKTQIRFLTDGLLLREALADPLLSRYSVIMVDEAHERSLSTDILLGVLRKIRKRRADLRIIVSSATLQAATFLRFFQGSEIDGKADAFRDYGVGQIISLEGRMFPVDILFLEEPAENYVEKAIRTIFNIHATEADGDVLVLLTGREEIDTAIEMITDRAASLHPKAPSILALPIYAGLTTEQQLYVFEPAPENTRKVIVSTNIAEASVTIDGIVYVIDCGFVKLRTFNPQTGIETLTATPVSKASAIQRAGRAGRTRPGKCFHLYTEAAYNDLQEATVPEIQRSNLAPAILQLKALGIDNVLRFDFLTPPPSELIVRGLELLYSLGALDDYAKLSSPLGIRMAELSVEPLMAKVLLSASTYGCLSEMLTVAAMISLQGGVWFHHESDKKSTETARRKFAADEGDHLTLLNVYQAFVTKGRKESGWCRDNYLNFKSMTRAVSIRNQLKRYLEKFGIDTDESLALSDKQSHTDNICKCLTAGFFAHAARMQPDGSFRTVSGDVVLHAHPSSLLFPPEKMTKLVVEAILKWLYLNSISFLHAFLFFALAATLRWFTPLYRMNLYTWPMWYDEIDHRWFGPDYLNYPDIPIIPGWAPTILLFAAPVLILAFVQIFECRFWEFHAALMGGIMAVDILTIILLPLKTIFPYPRPTFLSVCQANETALRLQRDALPKLLKSDPIPVNVSSCANMTRHATGDRWSDLKYQLNAFPSGTTANAFAVGAFLALYLNATLKPYSTKQTALWKVVAVLSPLMGALMMSLILLQSNNNFPSVIIISAFLGVACAFMGYRSYFRSIFDNSSNHLYFGRGPNELKPELPFHNPHLSTRMGKGRRKVRTD